MAQIRFNDDKFEILSSRISKLEFELALYKSQASQQSGSLRSFEDSKRRNKNNASEISHLESQVTYLKSQLRSYKCSSQNTRDGSIRYLCFEQQPAGTPSPALNRMTEEAVPGKEFVKQQRRFSDDKSEILISEITELEFELALLESQSCQHRSFEQRIFYDAKREILGSRVSKIEFELVLYKPRSSQQSRSLRSEDSKRTNENYASEIAHLESRVTYLRTQLRYYKCATHDTHVRYRCFESQPAGTPSPTLNRVTEEAAPGKEFVKQQRRFSDDKFEILISEITELEFEVALLESQSSQHRSFQQRRFYDFKHGILGTRISELESELALYNSQASQQSGTLRSRNLKIEEEEEEDSKRRNKNYVSEISHLESQVTYLKSQLRSYKCSSHNTRGGSIRYLYFEQRPAGTPSPTVYRMTEEAVPGKEFVKLQAMVTVPLDFDEFMKRSGNSVPLNTWAEGEEPLSVVDSIIISCIILGLCALFRS